MPNLPELPIVVPTSEREVRGLLELQPIFQTQRGKIPEYHPYPPDPNYPVGAMVYEESDD